MKEIGNISVKITWEINNFNLNAIKYIKKIVIINLITAENIENSNEEKCKNIFDFLQNVNFFHK